MPAWFPPCLFHQLTGLFCPGCGTTRAILHLLHGEFREAVGSNPLLLVALPMLAVALAESRTRGMWRERLRRVVCNPAVGWGFAVVTILFGILRNLPLAAFRWMAP
jgi:hypothetical protein